MSNPEPAKPWYQRSLLPGWLPEWLAASSLIAIGFGVCFGLFLESRQPWLIAGVAGLIGFAIALVILSLASARSPDTPEGQRLAPPAVIRLPILTVLFSVGPFLWLSERPIAAEIIPGLLGIAWMFLVASAVAWRARELFRRTGRVPSGEALSLIFALLAFAVGIALVVRGQVG